MPGPKPRPAVVKMAPYSPPASGREGKLRLDFNENTVGCSPRVTELLRRKLSEDQLTVYPEYEATRRALADYFQVPENQFLLTNGTDEAIQVLINTYVDIRHEDERFVDTVRRVGIDPFKERVYAEAH